MENMQGIDLVQGSDLWLQARCGSVGASRIADIMAETKNGEAASAKNYRAELVCEILTGVPTQTFVNAAMARGTELEPAARECYSFVKGVEVEQVGLILHPTIQGTHASPDGLIGLDGMVEIKVPTPANHIEYLMANKPPQKYIIQQQWQLACTGRLWNDFCSYCPELPEDLQLFIIRVERDNDYIAIMEEKVKAFLQSVDSMVEELKARKP